MFGTSTQKKYWIFGGEDVLKRIREDTNRQFVQKFSGLSQEGNRNVYLTPDEERVILTSFENHLKDFCNKFHPPMPKSVTATAFHYFKRFYLYNSVMDYHPKEILVTCVYLACKIDEFNVSISQFVANIKGDRNKAQDVIINHELMLMSALKFHLTVHTPYRAVEGYIIDIKTRYATFDAEVLRPMIEDFLDRVLLTDVPLLYTPSQIALASVLQAASKANQNLDAYVTDMLITDQVLLQSVIAAVKSIRLIVRTKNMETVPPELIKNLNKKLEKCRNQEHNPDNKLARRNEEEEFD